MEEEKKVVEETSAKPVGKVDKFFEVTKRGSTIKIEIIAGIVTFLAMAYILTVNPNQILGFARDSSLWPSVFIATAFGAIIGTLLMALLAKMPLAQAPGMGLNSMIFLTFIGAFGGLVFSFGNAMLMVLISGILFLVLSIVPCKRDKETGSLIALRELIFDGMPKVIRASIPVGIGLFIAFIGFQNAGIIVKNQYTLVQFVDWNVPSNWVQGGACCRAVVAIFGLLIIGILSHFKIKGSVIIGIVAATLLAMPLGVANFDIIKGNSVVSWKFWENFQNFFSMDTAKGGSFLAAFTEGFNFPSGSFLTVVVLIITFCMIDMFDTMGTVVGCTTSVGLVDESGKPLNYNKIMIADSVATVAGSLLGTSTVTTFVESGSGIAEGGRTGLTALTVAALFFLAIFIAPLFAFIPTEACAAALIYVGVLMMKNVVHIDFSEIRNAIPAFLTIVMMLVCYSITDGIGVGIVSYVLINFVIWLVQIIAFKSGKREEKPKLEISVVLLVVFAFFMVYFLVPTSF